MINNIVLQSILFSRNQLADDLYSGEGAKKLEPLMKEKFCIGWRDIQRVINHDKQMSGEDQNNPVKNRSGLMNSKVIEASYQSYQNLMYQNSLWPNNFVLRIYLELSLK